MSGNETPASTSPLPVSGPGSPASWPRRFGALIIDWLFANAVAYAVTGGTEVWDAQHGLVWVPLVCWYVMVVAATAAVGGSVGQLILGIRVTHIGWHRVSVITAAVRTLMIALVIPPLVFTSEGRGLHDIVSNTAVVNAS